jgi:hypothetical protein
MITPLFRYRTNAMEEWLQLIAATDLNGFYWLFTE